METFEDLQQLPETLNLKQIRGSSTLEYSLRENEACWYKKCRDKFNKTKADVIESRFTRSSLARSKIEVNHNNFGICFCDMKDSFSYLLEACMFYLDSQVRSSALLLGKTNLLER